MSEFVKCVSSFFRFFGVYFLKEEHLCVVENEKVLSAIARWATYASMKVSQAAFGDPLFVAMLQAARGPHETKGLVPKLTRSAFKGTNTVRL